MSQVKTYAYFMNEITPSEIFEGLLAYGLFSAQLPPIFTGKPFFDFCLKNGTAFPNEPAGFVYYENMRNTNVPRPLGIPNPIAYHNLCRCISANWNKLQAHFQEVTKNDSHIISRIHIRKMKDKPNLFEMNYNNWRTDGTPEPDMLIGAKFMVKADISNCFPSIYTHALSWALVGKNVAKQNQKDRRMWYNTLDFYTRNIRDGETHGLVIGPHTSNLLSEIILTKIDEELSNTGFKFIRNIDDYSCYVETYERGRRFLVVLHEQLRHYGLLLNNKKTAIAELPEASISQWVRRLNSFTAFDSTRYMNYKEVQAFIDLAVDLMRENGGNAAVIKYIIKLLSKTRLSSNAKCYYIKSIQHLALIYPYLVPQLDQYVFDAFSIEKSVIRNFSQQLLESGLKTRNYEEACFALYFAIKHNFRLADVDYDLIVKSNHCIFLLLSYIYNDLQQNKRMVRDLKSHAEFLMQTDMNAYWLFIYEILPQSKLKNYWKGMKKSGVTFLSI